MSELIERLGKLCERRAFAFGLVVIASLLSVVAPILLGGLHASGDLEVYLGFADAVRGAWATGDVLPGWAGDNSGFGSVGIRFYPPVSIYTLASLSALLGSWYHAIWTSYVVWMVVGCWGVYLCVKEWGTPLQGVIASCLYALAPFHVAEIYQFSLFAQFAAGSIFPYCMLFAARLCKRSDARDIVGLGISICGLVLTHVPSIIIGGITLGVFGLVLINRPTLRVMLRGVAAICIALLLSAFYWVTVVTELAWVAHNEPRYTEGISGPWLNLFPMSLFEKGLLDYYLPVYRNLDVLVVLTVLLILPLILLLSVRRLRGDLTEAKRTFFRAIALSSGLGVFMLTELSLPVWTTVPGLDKIQFPWRWLSVLSVLGTIAFTMSISHIAAQAGQHLRAVVAIAAMFVVLIAAYDVRRSFMRANTVTESEVTQMLETRDSQAGTTFEAWWPRWARAQALVNIEPIDARGRDVRIIQWQRENKILEVAPGEPGAVRIATFYYPHWRAVVNGKEAELQRDENGAILLVLDRETSLIALSFEEPGVKVFAGWISAIGFLSVLFWMISRSWRRRKFSFQLPAGPDNA